MPRPWLFTLAGLLALASPSMAQTARSLSDTLAAHVIKIDGFTNDFTDCERVFCHASSDCDSCGTIMAPEESFSDSKWGVDNDINGIRITWDARNLYIAGEGVTYDNNMILFIDAIPNQGLATMTKLNSWRRNFSFSSDFNPDVFVATWDNNTSPQLLVHVGGDQVQTVLSGSGFRSVATFSRNLRGRAMEAAIPWRTLFAQGTGANVARDTVLTVGGVTDTVTLIPPGTMLKVCGVITAGGDGTSGPDSAPDNSGGHQQDASVEVVLDNYALVDLDRKDDTGLGHGGPDGVPDWGVEPRTRIRFKIHPPIQAVTFQLKDVTLDRPAFAPTRNEHVGFSMRLDPPLDPTAAGDRVRRAKFSANVFDLRGRFVRNLFVTEERPLVPLASGDAWPDLPAEDRWDGRDANGNVVPAGIYVLRVVLEPPNSSRVTRPIVVVR